MEINSSDGNEVLSQCLPSTNNGNVKRLPHWYLGRVNAALKTKHTPKQLLRNRKQSKTELQNKTTKELISGFHSIHIFQGEIDLWVACDFSCFGRITG